KLADLPRDQRIPVPARLIPMLASGNQEQTQRAVEIAWRRLRGAGLIPSMPFDQVPELLELDPRRVAASMLVPITYSATGALVRTALTQSELSDDAA
ncbi:MAG: hypothetical protein LJE91_13630, partial [Gammaproteobacteria bacterium]|nr:hypothetical protein [Gammaproteobacteria bacterium]